MKSVDEHEAKTHLSKLLALVEGGQEIVISRAGKAVARLVPHAATVGVPVFGGDHGRPSVPDDFDAPLSEVRDAFEGRRR
jgi:prevent-host-death family protein